MLRKELENYMTHYIEERKHNFIIKLILFI